MGFLDTLGLIDGTTHLIRGALEMRLLLLPHRQNEDYRLAQLTQPLWGVRIGIAIGVVFVFIPARPDAKVQAAMRVHIDGTGHFCQQGWVAITLARDHLADADGSGVTRQPSRTHPAFKRYFLPRVGNRVEVVNQPGGSETDFFSRLSDPGHGFVGFHGILDRCQIHGPALGDQHTKCECHAVFVPSLPRFCNRTVYRLRIFDVFSPTASRMSAFRAASSTVSPSWKSMARTVLLSKRVLKRFFGSFS